jgi:D-xylose transport system substrate-binding protein
MKKINLIGFIVIVLVIVVIGGGLFLFFKLNKKPQVVIKNKNILVGFSITTLQEERWQKDKAEFLKEADKMGVSVDLQIAQNDASKQISQIDSMIVNGEDIIVVVPYKADALTDVIDRAHKAGIKVISYDRLIQNANTDLYVSFDNEKVGEYQAQYVMDAVKDKMDQGNKIKVAYVGGSPTDNNSSLLKQGSFKVLQPLIDSGKIQMVSDSFTVDWNPDNAYKNMKDYLSKNKAQVDAVVAANDGTAFGVISALK